MIAGYCCCNTTFSKKLQGRQKTVCLFATLLQISIITLKMLQTFSLQTERWEYMGIICPLQWWCIMSVHDEHFLVLNFLCPVVLFFRWLPLNYLLPITAGQNVNQESLLTILWYHPAPLSMGVILYFWNLCLHTLHLALAKCQNESVMQCVISKTDCPFLVPKQEPPYHRFEPQLHL